MQKTIDYKTTDNSGARIIINRSDLRVMLWAGDCVHGGVPDVQRLPDYDIYVCNGYPDLQANLDVLPDGARICLIDINDNEQFMRFVNDFTGKCMEINSDYFGSTPSLSIDTYSILLAERGYAYNTEGIRSGFNPMPRFRIFLELFAPVLTPGLKAQREWTPQILKLAEWNCISPEFVYTDYELKNGTYRYFWDEQNCYWDDRAKLNPKFAEASKYTKETLEEYWALLPYSVLRNTIHAIFDRFMDSAEKELIESYYPRLQRFLWTRVVNLAYDGSGIIKMNDVNEYVLKDSDVKRQIDALQTVIGLLDTAEKCVECDMTPTIGYYDDSRRPSEDVFGLWIKNS